MPETVNASATITLSLNELRALLRRTYEALYHHGYDFGVMARSCLWLESHGLDGIGLILRSLDDLDTPCAKMQLSEPSRGHYIIDGQSRCLIPFVNSAADLAIARAKQTGTGMTDIWNVFGRLNIFAALKKSARLDMWSAAIWYDYIDGSTYVLWLDSGSMLPNYYRLAEKFDGPWGGSGLRFICADSPEPVTAQVRAVLKPGAKPLMDAAQFHAAREAALENGLTVSRDDYDALNALANRLLVPSTDASRRGAGE